MTQPAAHPAAPPLLASDIASQLPPEEWRFRSSGAVYPRPQTRITLITDQNPSHQVLAFDERDPEASELAFGKDFLAAIGDHLSPRNLAALMTALAHELSAWQVQGSRDDDYTGDLLRTILSEHEARRLAGPDQPSASAAPR